VYYIKGEGEVDIAILSGKEFLPSLLYLFKMICGGVLSKDEDGCDFLFLEYLNCGIGWEVMPGEGLEPSREIISQRILSP